MSSVPTPSIYLRNRFTLQGAKNHEFLAGKEQLLRSTLGHWRLVAACGERAVCLGRNLPEPALQMIHVWELDSWQLLYDSMYELSEAKWYRALGDTVSSENQELLVNFTSGYGICQRRPWQSDVSAGYNYVSEEWRLSRGTTMHAFMRELNWLAAELQRSGILRVWCARQITGQPGLICVLWQVPQSVDVYRCLDALAAEAERGARYGAMLKTVATLRREIMFPMYTERLDERIRAGERERIVRAPELWNPHGSGPTAPGGLTLT